MGELLDLIGRLTIERDEAVSRVRLLEAVLRGAQTSIYEAIQILNEEVPTYEDENA